MTVSLVDAVYQITLAMGFLGIVDILVARHLKARWFFVHFVGNLMVTLTALPDVFRSFRDPLNSSLAEGDWTMWPCYFIGAIHLYHNHFFGFDLTPADTMHHFAFAFPFVFIGSSFDFGPGKNLVAFAISGLPGGIVYLLLVLQKAGYVSNETVKRTHARVDVWLRAPLLMFCSYSIYLTFLYNPDTHDMSLLHRGSMILLGILCMLNGQHYMQQIVGSTYKKVPGYSG